MFREDIVEGLRLHVSSSLNTLQNWSAQLSLTVFACPDVISGGLAPQRTTGWAGAVGLGGWKAGVALLEKFHVSASLVQFNSKLWRAVLITKAGL